MIEGDQDGYSIEMQRVDFMSSIRPIPCGEHGRTTWCYEQRDGSHIDAAECACRWNPDPECPVDAHREEGRRRRSAVRSRPE
jgi:hypothetical protein